MASKVERRIDMTSKSRDSSDFIQYIRKLAKLGEPGAQFVFVYYLSSRPNASKYRHQCLEVLFRLSKQENSIADYILGNWYTHGLGVKKDYKKAFKYFLSAAQKGHPSAQYDVGVSFEKGAGTIKNLEKAFKWYRKAALQNDPTGQMELGLCYFHGVGIARNIKKAIFWYRKAAKNGNLEAIHTLAALHKT